jgi:ketosteroid isomerase-like protein
MTLATVEFASDVVRNETFALDAAERFYVGLNRMFAGDVDTMSKAWSRRNDVILMGPFGGRQVGYDDVLGLFKRDASLKKGGLVTPVDLLLRVKGDIAYSIAIERGDITTKSGTRVSVDLRGTNILERDGDTWRIVYHHTDPLPEMQTASSLKIEDFGTLKVRPDDSVLKAIKTTYDAIAGMFTGDVDTLAKLWSHGDDVSLGCPDGNWMIGWDKVRDRFEKYSRMNIRGSVKFKDPLVRVSGDLAYASYVEYSDDLTFDGKPLRLDGRVTSIFTRKGGTWLQIHHHADVNPTVKDFADKGGGK